jgi:dolichol-phosphate mannosyltransferase
MSDALVVIPTYNERENVRDVVHAVLQAVPDVNLLFVDDNSPDGTGQLLDQMGQTEARLHVLHRECKEGLGRAYVAGFQWALKRNYQFIMEIDCDFSHDPAALPDFLRAIQEADLVLGTRYRGGIRVINWPLARLILSKGAAWYVKWVTGMPFTDPTGGFKCFRRGVLESIDLDRITSNGYSFQIEMTHQAWMSGFKVVEVPITFEERRSGMSKMSTNIIREALVLVWKLLVYSGFRRHPAAAPHARSVAAARAARSS